MRSQTETVVLLCSLYFVISTGTDRLFIIYKSQKGSLEFRLYTLTPLKRRIVYVTIFEILAILLSTLILVQLSGSDAAQSLPLAIMVSGAAVVWNFIYNSAFEYIEKRWQINHRTLIIRALHALGFEGGLILICLPLYMLWFNVGIWTAFIMEAALLAFFLIYTFIFTLIFDKIFPLPQHARTSATST